MLSIARNFCLFCEKTSGFFPFLSLTWRFSLDIMRKNEQTWEKTMKEFNIRLSTIEDVRSFVDVVSRCEYDVDLSSGRYIVDGKSIIGIFSLDLMGPLRMTVHGDEIGEMEEKLSRFLEG